MSTLIENNWPLGWIPSAADKENIGSTAKGLLRMDNLTLDELGTLRLAKAAGIESSVRFSLITSIFGAYINGRKLRYIYNGIGVLTRNYNPSGAASLPAFDLTLFGPFGSPPLRACFLNALGHILCIAGTKKYKDRGDLSSNVIFPLGIPAPAAPVLSLNAAPSLSIDLSVAYSNIESSAFAAIGTTGATFTPASATSRGVIQSISASTFDTTNLGGTGHDTPDDVFYFNFEIDDADQLSYVKIELYNDLTPTINYFWREWDFQAPSIATVEARVKANLGPFNITSGVTQVVSVLRSEFTHVGADATKSWNNIKAIRVTVGVNSLTSITFDAFSVKGGDTGPLTGEQSYVTVEVRDTGQYLEFSPASSIVKIDTTSQSVHLTRASAVNSQANQIWYFRKDDITGEFIAIHKETGAEGFTPAAFDDKLSDDNALISASVSPQNVIEPYRTALPDNIIGMIYFRDRIVYLTLNAFIPSYKLDPGSYDARFVYELSSTTSEVCLFITKIDVGTFLIATTRDFYRVQGTFNNLTDAASGVTIQDINIYSLGISDPAISQSFVESEGNIIYMSSSGIRALSNTTSVLLNGSLDLLFKGEARYGIEPISLLPANNSIIACATNGIRIYWSLPFTDGINKYNRIFVYTVGANPHWRLLNENNLYNNISCMFREEDGTIIYGAIYTDYIKSIESANTGLPIYLKTQLNFNNSPDNLKDVNNLIFLINTGGNNLNLIVSSLNENGSILTKNYVINTSNEKLHYIDLRLDIKESLAYAIDIYGITDKFSLKYFLIDYDIRPVLVLFKRLLAPAINGKMGRRSISAWPFRINPRGGNVIVEILVDGTIINDVSHTQTFTGNIVSVFEWLSQSRIFGYNWEIFLSSQTPFEFFEFLNPIISQEAPTPVKRIILPYNPFGKAGRKTLQTFPFRINTLGSVVNIYVKCDGFAFPVQSINSGGDIIVVLSWKSNTAKLAICWEIELVCDNIFEFYEFLEPVISQQCPVAVLRTVLVETNFGEDSRKRLGQLPFIVNPLGATLTINSKIDGVDQPVQTIAGTADEIKTMEWINTANAVGKDYDIEIIFSSPAEFYEWMAPIILQKFPPKVYYSIIPFGNFGKAVKKKLSVWPLLAYTFNNSITLRVSNENGVVSTQTANSGVDIRTLFWYNLADINAIDWQLEAIAPNGMELYKIMDPDIIQIFPIGRLLDQLGPLDFNAKGLVYEFKLRVMNEGTTIHYKVYAQDDIVYEGDITTRVNKDEVFMEKFPKGIDPSICRIVLTSNTIFYRYSMEFKVRTTGKESEEKYITVN